MSQLTLLWTHTKGPSKEIDIEGKSCTSYMISESIDRLTGMGYHVDVVVPVLYKAGQVLELATIVISRPAGSGSADLTSGRP